MRRLAAALLEQDRRISDVVNQEQSRRGTSFAGASRTRATLRISDRRLLGPEALYDRNVWIGVRAAAATERATASIPAVSGVLLVGLVAATGAGNVTSCDIGV
jgi:hypothetical protein